MSYFTLPNWNHDDTLEVDAKRLTCTAEGWNGNTISGDLLDFDPSQRTLKIQAFDEDRALTLKFNQIKRLKIDSQTDTDNDFLPSGFLGVEGDDPKHRFVVHLRDGALFSGVANAHRKLHYGLWLFPRKVLDTDPFRVFIPKSGIKSFEVKDGGANVLSDTDFNDTVIADIEEFGVEASLGRTPSLVSNLEQLKEALESQRRLKPVPIGEALLGLGKITREQLAEVLNRQKVEKNQPLGQMLVDMKLVSAADLQTAFARKMGYPFVDVKRYPIDADALRQVPMLTANRLGVLPLQRLGVATVIAMQDPLQYKVIEELEFTTQCKVIPVVTTSADLPACISKAYRQLGLSTSSSAAPAAAPAPMAPNHGAHMLDAYMLAESLVAEAREQADELPIEQSDNTLVKLINSMITEAFTQRASDIHIEPYPGREKMQIRFRIDGELRPYLELPASYRNALIARIKIMCDLDISERRKPQDGKINFAKFGGLAIELRVATIPTTNGLEDVVIRILTSSEPLPLTSINLSAGNLKSLDHIFSRPYGLFLCVGPTGSGKTTTLHSGLKHINAPNRKIWTAEDPVEITQRGLRQIQVNPKIGWTFATALRTLLRADPDVIMVGEIRDHETAEMAIEASLTGHLVLSTLHTNSAPETVVRLIDLGVDPFSFADSLQGILAQRLVRRVCSDCSRSTVLDDGRLRELMSDFQSPLPPNHPLRDADALLADWKTHFGVQGELREMHTVGCERCGHTGYRGRLALHELLSASTDIRHLVQSRAKPQQLQAVAVLEGMRTLRQDGIEKVLQGLTTLAEVRSSTNI